ncbi:Chitobiosyldiphosphodolichol beta-mannosyltransferase [Smittium mucronatum]|uniref:Chitobiosyldiphosphodolichol beta-mannosyltransferase n=1 Tax=Smittium mucronatum TaxID=133383 RepID=A0A1R0H5V0_9FUNG|nr:Chitobiosyldiphosphodolichol beta-mannosyltransferase [Smittium mucronatum]
MSGKKVKRRSSKKGKNQSDDTKEQANIVSIKSIDSLTEINKENSGAESSLGTEGDAASITDNKSDMDSESCNSQSGKENSKENGRRRKHRRHKRKLFHFKKSNEKSKNVTIIVLGDIGMSPRMQFHAVSLAKNGFNVDIVAYKESETKSDLDEFPNIQINPVPAFPELTNSGDMITYYLYAFMKVTYQIFYLLFILLFVIRKPGYIIVQVTPHFHLSIPDPFFIHYSPNYGNNLYGNPPAIPTLIVARVICAVRRAKLIIDWHNYGFSILALRLGQDHILVKVATIYEKFFAKSAWKHICVTNAMADDLVKNWGIREKIITLHDKPLSTCDRLSNSEASAFWERILNDPQGINVPKKYSYPLISSLSQHLLPENPSESDDGTSLKRPVVLVTGTSYTPDEDLQVLLKALLKYNDYSTSTKEELPNILVIVTGKGPMKEEFLRSIEDLRLEKVFITTAWLSSKDYLNLLGSADIGVSLHTSSSGLDLPMKIVDMFGCGLPVLAYNFKCIGELVSNGVNGYIFNDSDELADQIKVLVALFHLS